MLKQAKVGAAIRRNNCLKVIEGVFPLIPSGTRAAQSLHPLFWQANP
jgi:hypothetical protein